MSVTINLTWTAPITSSTQGAPESYNVSRDDTEIASGITPNSDGELLFNDVGLPDAVANAPVTYAYTVSATNAAGTGPESTSASITI